MTPSFSRALSEGRSDNLRQPDEGHWSQSTDWKRLGEVVGVLKRRVEEAYHASDDQRAGEAHDDLIAAEHRLRMAERRK